MKKLKKRNVTLIEMMIVMFLIALISGVVAINMGGSLDEGKAFKASADIKNIENILTLRVANDEEAWNNLRSEWQNYVLQSPIAQNPKSLLKDPWGNPYEIETEEDTGTIIISSKKLDQYKKTSKTLFK